MIGARVLDPHERLVGPSHQYGARELAKRLPPLTVLARQVAATVAYGVHGRRKAGIGETFWQFRPYVTGESTSRIDWRRSARDHHVYVREREQESAHTIWIWIDRSASMAFQSTLAAQSKLDRAIVLGLAAADLLVRGGERVGLLGNGRPMATRDIVDRFADALIQETARGAGDEDLPAAAPLAARARGVLLSDFLSPPEQVSRVVAKLASNGASGCLVMVADPVEETFPFTGHAELRDVESGERLRVGRVESLRDDYVRRLAAHRDALRAAARANGWEFISHRTDRPASEALLNLRARLDVAIGVEGAR
jgi:uncharacterized protein (DUF58 family)